MELLSFRLLSKKFKDELIFRESKLNIGNFLSHTWDIIIELDKHYNCYECKFSSFSLKRIHIDKMLASKHKSDNISIFLVVLHQLSFINQKLKIIQGNTSDEKYDELLNEFKIISLEDFLEGNPF